MTQTRRTLFVTVLLLSLSAMAQARGILVRDVIPPATDPLGNVLEIEGVYRPIGLEDRAVVIYRGSRDERWFLVVPSGNAESDDSDAEGYPLKLELARDGSVETVLLEVDGRWQTVPPLERPSAPAPGGPGGKGQAPAALPDFDKVPARPDDSCDSDNYRDSKWMEIEGMLCLVDFFVDCAYGFEIGTAACCFNTKIAAPDCARFGLLNQ